MNSLDWIKVSIANTFGNGIDKRSFEQKVQWVDNQEDIISLVPSADEPYRFQRGIFELRKAMATGKTAYPIGLDAGASGIQVLSALTGCITGAVNTGLGAEEPKDIYLINYEQMKQMAAVPNTITRKDLKKALMTLFYGSSAVPRRVFQDYPHLLPIFYKACSITAPGAFGLYQILMGIMGNTPTQEEYRWTLPNGFVVSTWALDKTSHEVEIQEFHNKKVNVIRKHVRRTERYRALAANVAHSVDGFVAAELRGRAMWDRDQLERVEASLLNQGVCADWNASQDCMSIYKVKQLDTLKYSQKCKLLSLIQKVKITPQYAMFTVH